MAWIHHPILDVDVEVPDETVEIWCGEPGWRPGTRENPEPWEPPSLDDTGEPLAENSEPVDQPVDGSKKRGGSTAAATVPVGDTTTPDTED
jgi:hypothetical protein